MTARTRHILLVDDDPDVSWNIGRFLTRSNFKVITCGDGREALQILQKQTFDALVTDIQIPEISGLGLLDWTRRNRPSMTVVIMTAFGSPMMHNISIKKGAIIYLEKPLDPTVLVDVLRTSFKSDSFTGNVSDIDLIDYIQLLLITRRNTVIQVCSTCGKKGEIYVKDGDILHATCGNIIGEKAFCECLSFTGGNFASLPWKTPETQTIDKRGEHLLMEAARLTDENTTDEDVKTDSNESELDLDELFEDVDCLHNEFLK